MAENDTAYACIKGENNFKWKIKLFAQEKKEEGPKHQKH